jgi:hypothetical protein
MTGDRLSRRQDKALHRALASVVMTQFPNPERQDCPGTPVLQAIAAKRLSLGDPALEHVARCSPCFTELTEMRKVLRQQKMLWALGTVGTAAVLLAAFVAYFSPLSVESPPGEETVQVGVPGGSDGVVPPENTPETEDATPAPPPQPIYETALLDLRNASAIRTVEPSTSDEQPIEVPRGLLALTVQLPIGSDEGSYEVEIRRPGEPPVLTALGQATIQNGITTLSVDVDTRSIQPGEYEFGWRLGDFSRRSHPILIR